MENAPITQWVRSAWSRYFSVKPPVVAPAEDAARETKRAVSAAQRSAVAADRLISELDALEALMRHRATGNGNAR